MENEEFVISYVENEKELIVNNAKQLAKIFKGMFIVQILVNIIGIIQLILTGTGETDLVTLIATFVTIYFIYCLSKYIDDFKAVIPYWVLANILSFASGLVEVQDFGAAFLMFIISSISIYVELKYLKTQIHVGTLISNEAQKSWESTYQCTKIGLMTILISSLFVMTGVTAFVLFASIAALVGSVVLLIGRIKEMFTYKKTADELELIEKSQ